MKELADLAYTFGGWWIWFDLYGKKFSITHFPSDGVCTVQIDISSDEEDSAVLVGTVMELAEYVRKHCPEASEDSKEILQLMKEAVKVAIQNDKR
jgi:hypothetical protein